MLRLSINRLLAAMAVGGALALAALTPGHAQPYGYWGGHGGAYQAHYHWRSFHGSTCDFRNYSRDRQLHGTC